MSTLNPSSVIINATMATLVNLTSTTDTDIGNNSAVLTTLNPLYNSSNWNSTNDIPWFNITYFDPNYCPTCYYPPFATESPPSVDYAYTYLYYGLLLLLLCISIVCIRLGISRRNQAQRRVTAARRTTARQQAENTYGSTNNNCNNANEDNSCHMGPKELDFPPAYDEVMQSYLMAKQLQPAHAHHENDANEGAVGFTAAALSSSSENNLSTNAAAISTLTIDTDISSSSSNHNSFGDLNNHSMSAAATTVTTAAVVNLQPPSYESSIEMSNTKINNDHIV